MLCIVNCYGIIVYTVSSYIVVWRGRKQMHFYMLLSQFKENSHSL